MKYVEEDNRACWCPCGCGCVDDDKAPCGKLLKNGLCASCDEGNHEIPPPGVYPGVHDLIRMHLSILAALTKHLRQA